MADDPVLNKLINYTEPAACQRKGIRLLQYLSKFYAWYLFQSNASAQRVGGWASLADKLELVQAALRAVGFPSRAAHAYLGASKIYDSDKSAPVVQRLKLLRDVAYSASMLNDLLDLFGSAGNGQRSQSRKAQQLSNQLWLLGLGANLLSCGISKYGESSRPVSPKQADEEDHQAESCHQGVKDLCNVVVAASALEYVKVDNGIVGIAGAVSSTIGIMHEWQKLRP